MFDQVLENSPASYLELFVRHAVASRRRHQRGEIFQSMTEYFELRADLYHQSCDQRLVGHAGIRTDKEANRLIRQRDRVQLNRGS